MDSVLTVQFAISSDGMVRIIPSTGREVTSDFWTMFSEPASLRGRRARVARLKRDENFRRRLMNAGAEVPEIEVAEQFLHAWLDAAAYELGFMRSAEAEAAWHLMRSRRADRSTTRRAA